MILAIARNEFKSLFRIPLGWILLAVCLVLSGFIFYTLTHYYLLTQGNLVQSSQVELNGVTREIATRLIGSLIYSFLIVIPVLAMRAISSEKNQNTLTLLLAAPISERDIVSGKFFGMLAWLSILISCVLLMSLTLMFGASLDYVMLFSALLGILLVSIMFLSVSFLVASASPNPAITITASISVLLVLLLVEYITLTGISWIDQLLAWLSFINHLNHFLSGNIRSQDIFYFVIISGSCLWLTFIRFKAYRRYS